MSYLLPIPHYQYRDYRERVFNETSTSAASVEQVEKVTFEKVIRDQADPQISAEERRKKRQREHEAFRVHLAQISGKGFEIDQLV